MLHLFPIRLVLTLVLIATAIAVLAGIQYGVLGAGDTLEDMTSIFRWASMTAIGLIILAHMTWRWIPFVQSFVFPYLGGKWSGQLTFDDKGHQGIRDVTLEIKHNLFKLKLLLESNESRSFTILAHAERDADFDRYRLFYIYVNERKEGVPNAGARYRGLAAMRVEKNELHGDYFTDIHTKGTLVLKQAHKNPWYKLWR